MENNRELYEPWYYRTINMENMESAALESVWALSRSAKEMAESTLHTKDIIETLRMVVPACAVDFWPKDFHKEMPNLQDYNAREHFKGFPEEIR